MNFRAASTLDQALASDSPFDAVILVGPLAQAEIPEPLGAAVTTVHSVDASFADRVALHAAAGLPGQRLILAPTGPLHRDYDDARNFADAAGEAAEIARDAGSTAPLLCLVGKPADEKYARALEVALLGAAATLWQPLEARERGLKKNPEPIETIGFVGEAATATRLEALEDGRRLARDLAGTEPERMAPPRFAETCEQAFAGTDVKVTTISDIPTLEREYPLLMAVGRASLAVERHQPRVIRLEYVGAGPIERTLLLAGKGVVYDTGGADLKVGGHMSGMSRDKGGAAGVAGFVLTVAKLAPKNLRVVAELGAVRNSIGSDCFVSDEIITGHSGKRVRIGNTDAEGRLVLADLLSHLRLDGLDAVHPALMSVATLTGHAGLAVGPYSIAIENQPARDQGLAQILSETGDAWGDPFAISRSRREDFEFVKGRTKADDVLSCNNAPSSQTSRGHQFPMAFLVVAAGLHDHDASSDQPLPFTHIDIGGSGCVGGDWQHGSPSAAPLVALAQSFVD